MARDIDEVLASQNKMLDHRGEDNETPDDQMKEVYQDHLRRVRYMVKHTPNFEMLEVNYRAAIDDPAGTADAVNEFLGGRLDRGAMSKVVDLQLYRNRKEKL